MDIYYYISLVDADGFDFTIVAYQAEIILRLSAKPEIGWYTRNILELQSRNCIIGSIWPTKQLITHI